MVYVLLCLGLAFFLSATLCYILTAVEAALTYLPHSDAEELTDHRTRPQLSAILDQQEAHMFSVRLWRVAFEMVSVVLLFAAVQNIAHNLWVSSMITALVMTLIGFVLFGFSPRSRGRAKPDRFVKRFYRLVFWLTKILGPLPLAASGRQHERTRENDSGGYFTEDELREFVDRANTSAAIEDAEAQMVHSIFDLDETRIRSVMVPRTDMVTISIDDPFEETLHLFLRSGYSRIPVLGEDFDDVRGFLYLKDLVEAHSARREGTATGIAELLRPARYEPESKRVLDLLKEMQREATHVAIVVDEYGGTAGLVTLEDLIEELVGDISDEFDNEKPEISMQDSGRFKVSSRLSLGELGELFGKDLEEDGVETVGGLMSKRLGRVPIVGSEIVVDGIHLRAVGVRGRRNRIGTVLAWSEDAADGV